MNRGLFNCIDKMPQGQPPATGQTEYSRSRNLQETWSTCAVQHPRLLIGSSVLKSAVCLFTYLLTYLLERQGLFLYPWEALDSLRAQECQLTFHDYGSGVCFIQFPHGHQRILLGSCLWQSEETRAWWGCWMSLNTEDHQSVPMQGPENILGRTSMSKTLGLDPKLPR